MVQMLRIHRSKNINGNCFKSVLKQIRCDKKDAGVQCVVDVKSQGTQLGREKFGQLRKRKRPTTNNVSVFVDEYHRK